MVLEAPLWSACSFARAKADDRRLSKRVTAARNNAGRNSQRENRSYILINGDPDRLIGRVVRIVRLTIGFAANYNTDGHRGRRLAVLNRFWENNRQSLS
jgi:hypothetical protein